jgi:uncharacterized membrane protein
MHKGRLEAFSDGVLAIIITIMVLELRAPHEATLDGLKPLIPVFLSYVLSFIYVGIYWNNHHHMLQATTHVTGAALWANLHLLFWLSLIPFATSWMGDTHFEAMPVAAYGVILLMASIAYMFLQHVLIRSHGQHSALVEALGRDYKGKVSPLLYAISIPLAMRWPWIACSIYAVVALMWLIPDPRIERKIERNANA